MPLLLRWTVVPDLSCLLTAVAVGDAAYSKMRAAVAVAAAVETRVSNLKAGVERRNIGQLAAAAAVAAGAVAVEAVASAAGPFAVVGPHLPRSHWSQPHWWWELGSLHRRRRRRRLRCPHCPLTHVSSALQTWS